MGDTAPPQSKEGLQTEAAELEQDIKEAQADAADARKAGDDERAAKLEASITETKTELAEVKSLLKQLVDRPFAPAPGDGETPPAGGGQDGGQDDDKGDDKGDGKGETPPAEQSEGTPKAKKHWMFGDRWNQE